MQLYKHLLFYYLYQPDMHIYVTAKAQTLKDENQRATI